MFRPLGGQTAGSRFHEMNAEEPSIVVTLCFHSHTLRRVDHSSCLAPPFSDICHEQLARERAGCDTNRAGPRLRRALIAISKVGAPPTAKLHQHHYGSGRLFIALQICYFLSGYSHKLLFIIGILCDKPAERSNK